MTKLSRFTIAALLLVLTACATGPRPGAAPQINPAAQAVDAYRIGVDDVIRVAVWQNPDLNVTVPVRPDGRISVPLVGDVEAGGRTPEEVSAEIKTALEKYVRNPQVT
ncbi:MAG: polysaccharide biosynthesis/export family protein, partial [Xanthomonadales bacterium]|nr:polysaccharide biosynthesis/export family protein [Xanthomonadales bacterium]